MVQKALALRTGHGGSDEGFFFFSSRRRHTRSLCDWSSDVCSSDLQQFATYFEVQWETRFLQPLLGNRKRYGTYGAHVGRNVLAHVAVATSDAAFQLRAGIAKRH